MTTLLLIRHGESMANTEKRFAGHWDIPLSPLGQRQAETTAAYIADTYTVGAVYASDLARAYDTGKAVADRLGLCAVPERGLREIMAGDWERATFDELAETYPDSYTVWRQDIGNAVCDNGESVADLQKRVLGTLTRIAEAHDGQTVVIATHATPIRALQCHSEGKPLADMKNIPWVSNASLTTVAYEGGTFRLICAGDDRHLGTARTALPKNV